MSGVLIRGGRILDPASGRDEPGSLLAGDGRIQAVGPDLDAQGAEIIDAAGAWIAPGFFDMHCHLREPGQEYKENIGSGGRSAVAGGFTAVACMANTHPVNDDPAMTDLLHDGAEATFLEDVEMIEAQQKNLEGGAVDGLVDINADNPPLQMRRIMDNLIAAEADFN